LRENFSERVKMRLEVIAEKNQKLEIENQVLSVENVKLKVENEQAKNDLTLLAKIKKHIGNNNFNQFLSELFKTKNPKIKI